LRLKCLYVISACSLLSLVLLVCLVHLDGVNWDQVRIGDFMDFMRSLWDRMLGGMQREL